MAKEGFFSEYIPSLLADLTRDALRNIIPRFAQKAGDGVFEHKRDEFMVILSQVSEPERSVLRARHLASMPNRENRFITLLMSAIDDHELEEQIDYLRYVARLDDRPRRSASGEPQPSEFEQELIGLEHDPIPQFFRRVGKKFQPVATAVANVAGALDTSARELASTTIELNRDLEALRDWARDWARR